MPSAKTEARGASEDAGPTVPQFGGSEARSVPCEAAAVDASGKGPSSESWPAQPGGTLADETRVAQG